MALLKCHGAELWPAVDEGDEMSEDDQHVDESGSERHGGRRGGGGGGEERERERDTTVDW
jgi:hypothetical protein